MVVCFFQIVLESAPDAQRNRTTLLGREVSSSAVTDSQQASVLTAPVPAASQVQAWAPATPVSPADEDAELPDDD